MAPPIWLGLVAFVSGACLMTLEIIAGRLLAPFVGSSIHTWTSIIGVVLAGLSLGAFLGGRWIDRRPSRNKLALALVAAGLCSSLGLGVDALSARLLASHGGLPAQLALAAVLFLPPSLFLGAITPMTARLALRDVAESGHTIGWLHALGAAGSIVGTFATGFGFVALGSSRHIVVGVALCLVLLGGLTLRARRARAAVALAVALLAFAAWRTADRLAGPCDRESEYHCIRVASLFLDGQSGKALYLDRMVHGYTFPNDATKLASRSSEIFAHLAHARLRHPSSSRALVLGGGGYVLPRYLAARFSSVELDVVEIDPEVTRVAREQLGFTPGPRLAVHHEDARAFVRRHPSARYDLVVADVFSDLSLPFHLSTVEFAREVRELLREDGAYALHLVDGEARAFLASTVLTLGRRFAHVNVARGSHHGSGGTASFVVIASDAPLDPLPPLRAWLMTPVELAALLDGGGGQVLTDDHAPVERLRARLL